MNKVRYCIDIVVPEPVDIAVKYRQYGALVEGAARPLFDFVVRPENIYKAMIVTDFGHPAVSGLSAELEEFVSSGQCPVPFSQFTRQCVGAILCVAMEANGYKKTGRRKAVQHNFFAKGEMYERDI